MDAFMGDLQPTIDQPVRLEIQPDGEMIGGSRRYDKLLGDLAGLYQDDEAYRELLAARGADALMYYVYDQRYQEGSGALIVGTSVLLPGTVGGEFAMTRGHLHAVSDRAELYHCVSGHGVMLLDTVDGRTEAVELTPGQAVNVPGEWIHRSVNVGDEPFVTLFCYAADAGQDYGIIADAGGMRTRIVEDGDGGWKQIENPTHVGYSRERRP
jgi:glucose-6-phosphate isomerase